MLAPLLFVLFLGIPAFALVNWMRNILRDEAAQKERQFLRQRDAVVQERRFVLRRRKVWSAIQSVYDEFNRKGGIMDLDLNEKRPEEKADPWAELTPDYLSEQFERFMPPQA